MTSHAPKKCCTEGVKHEGEASGEMGKIGDIETYFAHPESKRTDNAILFLPDVIGHAFINAQLMADQFAANGYFVVMPDQFDGDAIPLNKPGEFDFQAWRAKHPVDRGDEIVKTALKEMKDKYGCKRIGAVGYCWGAKWVVRFLKKGQLDAGYLAHPSFVDAEEIKAIEGPLSIAAAETDGIFPAEKRHETEKILVDNKAVYQINLYSGVAHGFAVRGDVSDKVAKYAKEQAFLQAVFWFDEHVKKENFAASL